ncbi:MAG: histidinol-phosphatase [Spirochaetales bacterium]|nr:histidinol-phosphatase [Spirochaetales bacterium]
MEGTSNYHCHSRLDDGVGELADYAAAAVEKGLATLGFSGHAPVPFETGWTMPPERLPEYLATVRRLKEEYAGRLEILLGLEVDFLPGLLSVDSPWIQELDLDFTVGSVHFLGRLRNGTWWTGDGPLAELEQGLEESYGGDIQAAVERFYALTAQMAAESPPDIIGHFDVIKKNNRDGRFFSEDAPWYRRAVRATLDAIARAGSIVEVNTGGLVRNTSGALYPSEWILAECLRRGIPVMVNSDAHRPEHIDGHFRESYALLRQVGYRGITHLSGGRRVEERL